MAKRPSNRDRLQRKALEAELTAKEKAEDSKTSAGAKKTKKKATSRAKVSKSTPSSGSSGRQKLVWRVVDPKSKVIATFAYPRKAEAEAKAAEMTAKSGQEHRVRGVKVPLE